MRPGWKAVVIGSEVTVLAAFTGVGIHLFMQPHRPGLAPPPPLTLPLSSPPPLPKAATPTPLGKQKASPRPAASPPPAAWLPSFGHDDRRQMNAQWEMLQRLMRAVERYVVRTLVPEMQRNH